MKRFDNRPLGRLAPRRDGFEQPRRVTEQVAFGAEDPMIIHNERFTLVSVLTPVTTVKTTSPNALRASCPEL